LCGGVARRKQRRRLLPDAKNRSNLTGGGSDDGRENISTQNSGADEIVVIFREEDGYQIYLPPDDNGVK
jgi:hypothetical protein